VGKGVFARDEFALSLNAELFDIATASQNIEHPLGAPATATGPGEALRIAVGNHGFGAQSGAPSTPRRALRNGHTVEPEFGRGDGMFDNRRLQRVDNRFALVAANFRQLALEIFLLSAEFLAALKKIVNRSIFHVSFQNLSRCVSRCRPFTTRLFLLPPEQTPHDKKYVEKSR